MKLSSHGYRPVVLIVLDGWGIAAEGPQNPITVAKIPNFRSYLGRYPHTQLAASGEAVGLIHDEPGNSEVGHTNLGAGYVVYQDLMRINRSIADGDFFQNQAFLRAVGHVKRLKSCLHLMGLISPAAVHSYLEHLYALLRLVKDNGVRKVFLHAFTDGRDSSPTSAQIYLAEIDQRMQQLKVGRIASVVGRYYAMDRDERWQRTRQAYNLLLAGQGVHARSYSEAISNSYREGVTDEFIKPTVLVDDNNQPSATIKDNDAVIFFNFRNDRTRQLTKAFVLPELEYFPRAQHLKNLFFVSMTEYEKDLPVSAIAYWPQDVKQPVAKVISDHELVQLHIAESEKFPHVTYFFNGGREDPFIGEERVEIPSPKVPTYDLKPEMSAHAITQVLLERLENNVYDFILINYANADMVAHTGVFDAGVKAAEVADECMGRVVNQVLGINGVVLITSDHGNLEQMINLETKRVDTEHNANPVPFIAATADVLPMTLKQGILADVAPTILKLLNLPVPSSMTARNLLE